MLNNEPHKPKVVIISGFHDYRTPRRASIQALADAFVRLQCDVTFISVRFSPISRAKGDHRTFLWSRANRPECINGVQCYLWRTPFHPVGIGIAALDESLGFLFSAYARLPNRFIDDELASASYIVVESGLGIALIGRARRLNNRARILYRASDALRTIGASPTLEAELRKRSGDVDAFCLLADTMASDFPWALDKTYVVPHGISRDDFSDIGASPYDAGKNAVTVGSMLFDQSCVRHAAASFPDIHFHLIGTGRKFDAPANVRFYDEMPFKATLPYIKHADFGIAAYRPSANSGYLAQSSLKLMQFEYLGLPAVCPDYAVGKNPNRFGFAPDNPANIEHAIHQALAHGRFVGDTSVLSWEQVAERLLHPERFDDTAIGGTRSSQARAPETKHQEETTSAMRS